MVTEAPRGFPHRCTHRAQVEMVAEMGRAHPLLLWLPGQTRPQALSGGAILETLGQDARGWWSWTPCWLQPPVMQLLKRLVTLAPPFALHL